MQWQLLGCVLLALFLHFSQNTNRRRHSRWWQRGSFAAIQQPWMCCGIVWIGVSFFFGGWRRFLFYFQITIQVAMLMCMASALVMEKHKHTWSLKEFLRTYFLVVFLFAFKWVALLTKIIKNRKKERIVRNCCFELIKICVKKFPRTLFFLSFFLMPTKLN